MPKPKMKEKKEKERVWKMVLHTSFAVAHYENAVNITMAHSQAGMYVNIGRKENGAFQIHIFKSK